MSTPRLATHATHAAHLPSALTSDGMPSALTSHAHDAHAAWSGKLQACARLLDAIFLHTEDKVVVVGDRLNVLQRIGEYVAATSAEGARAVLTLQGDVDMASRKSAIDRHAAPAARRTTQTDRTGCHPSPP